jgi:hypothetical protein
MALQTFVGPWPLLQFCNLFTQAVGVLGRVISPSQDRCLHTGQYKHGMNTHTDIHDLSGIEPMIPAFERAKTVHTLDLAAIVISGRRHLIDGIVNRGPILKLK